MSGVEEALQRAERAERERDEALRALRRLVKVFNHHDCDEDDGGFSPADVNIIAAARALLGGAP